MLKNPAEPASAIQWNLHDMAVPSVIAGYSPLAVGYITLLVLTHLELAFLAMISSHSDVEAALMLD